MTPTKNKKCSACKIVRSILEFYKCSRNPDKLNYKYISCIKEYRKTDKLKQASRLYSKTYNDKNREKLNEYGRQYFR